MQWENIMVYAPISYEYESRVENGQRRYNEVKAKSVLVMCSKQN